MVTPVMTAARKHFITLADCFSKHNSKGQAILDASIYKIAYSSYSMNWRDLIANHPSYEIDYVVIPSDYNPDELQATRLNNDIAVVVTKKSITNEMLNLPLIPHFQIPWFTFMTIFTWGLTLAPFDDRSELHYANGLTHIKECSDPGNGFLANQYIQQGYLFCFNLLEPKTVVSTAYDDFSGPIFAGIESEKKRILNSYLIGIYYGDIPFAFHQGGPFKVTNIAINVAYWAPWIQYIVNSDKPPAPVLQTKIARLDEQDAYKYSRNIPYLCRNLDPRFYRIDLPQPNNNSDEICEKYASYKAMNCWFKERSHKMCLFCIESLF
uniref:CSON000844 protein n=1 Tax=Culicoides sonorensis TaxID=179676 RepID=A0A336MFG9_CULSO